MKSSDQDVGPHKRVTAELVLRELRKHDFAVLCTVDDDGKPFAAGVNYGVSSDGGNLGIYVMTRRHLKKARNIARNPSIALVVPLSRRFLWFLPPATIQLRGRAEILDWTDPVGTEVFRRFWMGRRILEAYEQSRRRGETRVCFLKISPDPAVHTYMVGYNVWELRKRMEVAAAEVNIGSRHAAQPAGVGPITDFRTGWAHCDYQHDLIPCPHRVCELGVMRAGRCTASTQSSTLSRSS